MQNSGIMTNSAMLRRTIEELRQSFRCAILESVQRTTADLDISQNKIENIVSSCLSSIDDITTEIFRQSALQPTRLPMDAPVSYRAEFKARKAKHREAFQIENGRAPWALSDEDYTPVRFFQEIWGEYTMTGLITSSYLEKVDPSLYFALVNYVRGAHEGRPGRKAVRLTDLGITTERNVMRQLMPAKSKVDTESI